MSINEQLAALELLEVDEKTKEELSRFILGGSQPSTLESQLEEPFPDVQALFKDYDVQFFDGSLSSSCTVEWSKRMTLCAGICYYKKHPTKSQMLQASKLPDGVEALLSQFPRCIIRLSEPLLIFRDVVDLKQTLLHEMIHAYCFKFQLEFSREGHGDVFCRFMNTINQATGLRITVYHSFHDEVNHARKHVWRCTGICRNSKPFYGYVKRAMNRPPGPSDWWYARHQTECGGTYVKLAGPDMTGREYSEMDEKISNSAIKQADTKKQTVLNFPRSSDLIDPSTWSYISVGEAKEQKRTREFSSDSLEHPPKLVKRDKSQLSPASSESGRGKYANSPFCSESRDRCPNPKAVSDVEQAIAELSSSLSDTSDSPPRITKRPWITLESIVRARNKNIT